MTTTRKKTNTQTKNTSSAEPNVVELTEQFSHEEKSQNQEADSHPMSFRKRALIVATLIPIVAGLTIKGATRGALEGGSDGVAKIVVEKSLNVKSDGGEKGEHNGKVVMHDELQSGASGKTQAPFERIADSSGNAKNAPMTIEVKGDSNAPIIQFKDNNGELNIYETSGVQELKQKFLERQQLLIKGVNALGPQGSKSKLKQLLDCIIIDNANLAREEGAKDIEEELDFVEAQLSYLHGEYDNALKLINDQTSPDAQVLKFECLFLKRDFPLFFAFAKTMTGESIEIEHCKLRAKTIEAIQFGTIDDAPISLKSVSELLSHIDKLIQVNRSTVDPALRFVQLDLLADKLVVLNKWFDLIDTSTAITRKELVSRIAEIDLVNAEQEKMVEIMKAANQPIPLRNQLQTLSNLAGLQQSAFLSLLIIDSNDFEGQSDLRKRVTATDRKLHKTLGDWILAADEIGKAEWAFGLFQIAARAFERLDFEFADELVREAEEMAQDPEIGPLLIEDERKRIDVGSKLIHIEALVERAAQSHDVNRKEFESLLAWGEKIYKNRGLSEYFGHFATASKAYLLVALFSKDKEQIDFCRRHVADFLRLNADKAFRTEIRRFLTAIRESCPNANATDFEGLLID